MISECQSPGEVETEILMMRTLRRGSFLVVEGDSDSRFWSVRSSADCDIVIAGGKLHVVDGLTRLDARRFSGAVGIVDDDYDRLLGIPQPSPNLISTETRDLEGILLRSSALEKVLAEYGDPVKIEAFEARVGMSVREALLARAFPLGRLRWYSLRTGMHVAFEKLVPSRFIDVEQWSFDEAQLLTTALAQGVLPERDELVKQLNAMPEANLWDICQGHDMVDILGLGLESRLGNRNPGRDRTASTLRSGMEKAELSSTQLYARLCKWEDVNVPFRVLAI